MKKILLLFGLSLALHPSFAQVGIYTGFQWMEAPRWKKIFQTGYELPGVDPFRNTLVLGIDFQFPSEGKGLRLTPAIQFSDHRNNLKFVSEYEDPLDPSQTLEFHYNELHQVTFAALALHLDWYLLDSRTPANIPVYDKSGHWFSKGFFLQIAPTAQIISTSRNRLATNPLESITGTLLNHTQLKTPLKLGMGLDLGITSKFTLSPIFNYTFFGKTNFRYFGIPPTYNFFLNEFSEDFFASFIHQFQFGIRLGTTFH